MNKIAYSILVGAIAASSAFAGQQTASYKQSKEIVRPEAPPCFEAQEFQLDLFGSYTNGQNDYPYSDGFGGGIGASYFFTQYIGLGVDGNVYDGDASGVWSTTASVIARYPIQSGELCFAPYVFGGGGARMDSDTVGTVHAGAGLEFRLTPKVGLFSDARYTWGQDEEDAITTRVGVRFIF